jgi:hypothetical protein
VFNSCLEITDLILMEHVATLGSLPAEEIPRDVSACLTLSRTLAGATTDKVSGGFTPNLSIAA